MTCIAFSTPARLIQVSELEMEKWTYILTYCILLRQTQANYLTSSKEGTPVKIADSLSKDRAGREH